ncbi:hypothetical protein [Motilimonas eburnea]|uniref:hypothetical protein n=1 Tax=Motilimonas eburnea TaxID=1737488 RepID=UPI001E2DA372|nr:hypothetical protein [Motilimonas eburnea]MCE2573877.1 hypothetical protein [Motilimonas eburnea]
MKPGSYAFLAILVHALTHASAQNSSPAQSMYEALYGYCMLPKSNLRSVADLAEMMGGYKLPDNKVAPKVKRKNGLSYIVKHDNQVYLLSCIHKQVCSITSDNTDITLLKKKLSSSLKLRFISAESTISEVTEAYSIIQEGEFKHSIITLTYSLEDTPYSTATISYHRRIIVQKL